MDLERIWFYCGGCFSFFGLIPIVETLNGIASVFTALAGLVFAVKGIYELLKKKQERK